MQTQITEINLKEKNPRIGQMKCGQQDKARPDLAQDYFAGQAGKAELGLGSEAGGNEIEIIDGQSPATNEDNDRSTEIVHNESDFDLECCENISRASDTDEQPQQNFSNGGYEK